jgi:phosphinothricin acetyltransferase
VSADLLIRPAMTSDLPALVDIYNHYVTSSHCTFDTLPFNLASRQPWWIQFDGERHQCWLASDGLRTVGYACTSAFKPKPAYDTSVEISVYVDDGCGGRGIGQKLYEVLLPQLAQHGVHRAYAGIALPNDASIRLHEKFGFQQAAHFTEVGYKFDRYWDVVWLQLPV